MPTASSFQVGDVTIGGGQLFLIAGPCVIESEAHALKMAEAIAACVSREEAALHLQGVVRQGEPHLDSQLSRTWPRRRSAHSPQSSRDGEGPGADRRPRSCRRAASGRSRGRAADSCIPLPPDRPADRGREERMRGERQEGTVRFAVGHASCGREGARGWRRARLSYRARCIVRLQQSRRGHAVAGDHAQVRAGGLRRDPLRAASLGRCSEWRQRSQSGGQPEFIPLLARAAVAAASTASSSRCTTIRRRPSPTVPTRSILKLLPEVLDQLIAVHQAVR